MSEPVKSVLIVAGESSGELYGALLAEELRKMYPDVNILGVGGERMRAAGVDVFREVSGAFGLVEAVSHLKDLKKTMDALIRKAEEERPPVAVLIDFPDFNFKAAAELKKRGVKILYYVSPQIWAWRADRIKKMARLVDKMALILPFEQEIYRKAGIPSEFVGHPVLDEIAGFSGKTVEKEGREKILALLPGSRPSELKRHLPLMADVLRMFKREFPEWGFRIPLAPNLKTDSFNGQLRALRDEGAVIKKENALKVLSFCDAAVIASGTATLQAAFLERPFTVVYRLSPITFMLGRLLVKVKHVSLVNILSGREAVREFLQKDARPENVMAELRRLIKDPGYRASMIAEFVRVRDMFSGRSASRHTASMVSGMAGWGR
ncbi:MAG: lipid-A-disaccharide synthase [Nitrospiraceae bacterium]|nr:lipid-A-disaccharide synthase [Nitrospiraceae bacterium]